jgi:hypothetical protein
MNVKISLPYIIIIQLISLSLVFSATYYVAPWGSDDSSGTFARPWRTINKAASTMIAGDSVLIRAGNYKEGINPANSGTISDPITYAAYGGEEVTAEGGEVVTNWILDSGNRYRANVNFTPAPRFSSSRDPSGNLGGLVLQDGAKLDYAMSPSPAAVDSPGDYYMNDSTGMGPPYTMYVYLRDLGQGYDPNNYEMTVGRYRKGFDLDGGEDYQIVDGLTFRDYNDNAIHSIGSLYCQFKNLKLYSNFITGIYLTDYSRFCVIDRCLFWDNGHGGIELARSNRVTVKRNKFTCIDMGDSLGGNGAHMWLGPVGLFCDSCIIENNIGFKTGSKYMGGPFIYINGNYNMLRHNSGIHNRNTGMGGLVLGDGGDNTMINNAVDNGGGVSCVAVFPNAVADSGHFIAYNDFYALNPTEKYWWNGVRYNSLSDWQIASGQSNNIDLVPGFTQPDSENLHLIPGSNCIDAGTAVNAAADDYDGVLRPQGTGYDIGAYEYTGVATEENRGPAIIRAGNIIIVPNPGRKEFRIYRARSEDAGRLRIFDISGRLVRALDFKSGQTESFWNNEDNGGRRLPAGSYFAVYTEAASSVCERKIILLK